MKNPNAAYCSCNPKRALWALGCLPCDLTRETIEGLRKLQREGWNANQGDWLRFSNNELVARGLPELSQYGRFVAPV